MINEFFKPQLVARLMIVSVMFLNVSNVLQAQPPQQGGKRQGRTQKGAGAGVQSGAGAGVQSGAGAGVQSGAGAGVQTGKGGGKKRDPVAVALVKARRQAKGVLKTLVEAIPMDSQTQIISAILAQQSAIQKAKVIADIPTKESMAAALNAAVAQIKK